MQTTKKRTLYVMERKASHVVPSQCTSSQSCHGEQDHPDLSTLLVTYVSVICCDMEQKSLIALLHSSVLYR